ncbi:tRNA 2-thiouridine(34) synthase MnmA [Patescibacteria group bacterium]
MLVCLGGVDSATSAALLVEQGYDVSGVFLECWRAPGCRVDEDRKDAMDVALQLGIPFKVLDFKKEYKDRVVEYFYSEYQEGRTPNPDTMCNKEIKFGMFYDWAMKEGFDFVATGHYARVDNGKLLAGVDKKKDQSYFLYLMKKEQLDHVLFPLGEMIKDEVREEAKKRKLIVADKPDSQGICFIGPVDVRKFLEERITPKKGDVVNTKGEVVGSHDGVWFYTVGQRHGFTIDGKYKSKSGEWKHSIPPLYVIEKDVENNCLVVGFGAETLTSEFEVENIHWIEKPENGDLSVRIRHRGKWIGAKFKKISKDWKSLKVILDEPQRGVASGQAAVFYLDEQVLGGGIIV